MIYINGHRLIPGTLMEFDDDEISEPDGLPKIVLDETDIQE